MNKKILSSKITIVLLLALLVFFGYTKFLQEKNQHQIEAEKQSLIVQANELQKQNQDLSKSISYLNSSNFKEQVAREQLDLKRNGEAAYNFTQSKIQPIVTPTPIAADTSTNPQKWWNYFNSSNQ